MRLNARQIKQIISLESFDTFFSHALDKKLQHCELKELAIFVFGGIDRAVNEFLKENDLGTNYTFHFKSKKSKKLFNKKIV